MTPDGALRRAAELAARGRFRVEPNPPVGCVLLERGRIVGEGWHARWGGPHAEVEALRRAGAAARGATACVTLEPCGHTGKTPPCADALVRAGVREVVYARADPNPLTAGVGPARLAEAGVRVRRASRGPQGLLDAYVAHLPRKRPWVIAKWAMTLDGRIATRQGDSGWITSPRARAWAHRELRGTADAILVGSGTVRADDPELTNRSRRGRRPLRVVVVGRRPLPRGAKVLGGPALLALPEGVRAPSGGAEVLRCGRAGRVDVRALLRALHDRGIRRVLVEGGGELLGSLFDRGLVDQVCAFLAPKVVGGRGARSPVEGRGLARVADALRLDHATHHALGPDLVVEGYVRR